MREMQVLLDALHAGGNVVRGYFEQGVAIREKGTNDLVSDADIESEREMVRRIRAAFPDHEVMGEESHRGDAGAAHLWVLDPLDGTTNFAHQIPHFAISAAYYRQGQAVCGAVLNPMRADLFQAIRGQGATHNGAPIHVGKQRELNQVLVSCGFYYDRGAMMHATLEALRDFFGSGVRGIRRFGTASLDLCMVASGCVGAFFEYELSPWDFAGGRLIVEEAGGMVSTCEGAPAPLTVTSILATNGHLHPAALAITSRHAGDYNLPPARSASE